MSSFFMYSHGQKDMPQRKLDLNLKSVAETTEKKDQLIKSPIGVLSHSNSSKYKSQKIAKLKRLCCCFERAWTPRKLISAWGPSSYGSIASLGLETPEMEAAGAGAAGIPVFL